MAPRTKLQAAVDPIAVKPPVFGSTTPTCARSAGNGARPCISDSRQASRVAESFQGLMPARPKK